MISATTANALSEERANQNQNRFVYDETLDQKVYELELQPGFKECANLSRGVYFTSYLSWIGKVRELFMSEIGSELVPQISSGDWGLVTNWCELNVYGEATTYDYVVARFSLGKVTGAVIPLRCEFLKKISNGTYERLAYVEQETTWVEVIGHGKVRPAEFPPYLDGFLKKTTAKRAGGINLSPMKESLKGLEKGKQLYVAPMLPGAKNSIFTEYFNTTLEDANLVGNVYYGNYFIWQGRARDLFINSIARDDMRGIGENGEMVCIKSRLDYLRDAMPFDRVEISLSVREVYENGVVLEFEYYRILESGDREKLAVGMQEFLWAQLKNNQRETVNLPNSILEHLISD